MWRRFLRRSFAFVLPLSLLCCTPSAAFAKTFTVTEKELTRLEQDLDRLERRSGSREKALRSLTDRLTALNAELEKSRKVSADLRTENLKCEEQLQRAEQSFRAYEKEENRAKARLKRQRTAAYAVSVVLLVLLAR